MDTDRIAASAEEVQKARSTVEAKDLEIQRLRDALQRKDGDIEEHRKKESTLKENITDLQVCLEQENEHQQCHLHMQQHEMMVCCHVMWLANTCHSHYGAGAGHAC